MSEISERGLKMEKIKMVIWDLDETFWKGTLSEGSVKAIEANLALVKELTDRGIINSIVSKNDFEQAKAQLIEFGIWDYFVFPSISWNPKGQLIAELIEKAQLRPPNVLFLDDNHSNLKEAAYYNEGLHTEFPDFLQEIPQHPAFKGKDDHSHSRLNQYKILEKKHSESLNFSDNEEFLRSSEIKLHYVEDLIAEEERIYELLERTNQLNYTKIRLNPEETSLLIRNPNYDQRAITVSDRYGNYGVVGYLCYDKQNHRLVHFVFSCRILNLGVEQFLYAELGFPSIEVVPEVATALNNTAHPDWIEVIRSDHSSPAEENKDQSRKKILFKGGCDLGQMLHYLNQYNFEFLNETNYVGANNIPIHAEHSEIILDTERLNEKVKANLAETIPFIDSNTYKSDIIGGDYDTLIYSVLMDYTQDLYQNEQLGVKIPFGGYGLSLTNQKNWPQIIRSHAEKNRSAVNEDFLKYFSSHYSYQGQISPREFKDNLQKLRNKIPSHVPIIFINGAEIESPLQSESAATARHIQMNAVLDQFISDNQNCFLLDVRKYVNSPADISDNIRHFKRTKYKELSEGLLDILKHKIDLQVETNFISKDYAHGLLKKIRYLLWTIPLVRYLKRRLIPKKS